MPHPQRLQAIGNMDVFEALGLEVPDTTRSMSVTDGDAELMQLLAPVFGWDEKEASANRLVSSSKTIHIHDVHRYATVQQVPGWHHDHFSAAVPAAVSSCSLAKASRICWAGAL